MGERVLMLFLGAGLGAGGLWLYLSRSAEGDVVDACDGHCGVTTRCEDGLCVAVVDDPDQATEAKATKKRKRGRRRKSGSRADDPKVDGDLPPFQPVDDGHIPAYRAKTSQVLELDGDGERLSDDVVQTHLGRLESKFDECLRTAAMYSEDDLGRGDIDVVLGITSTGKVTGVTAKAPPNLRVFGIVPCVRKAVYEHRFPAFQGVDMHVDYSFAVR